MKITELAPGDTLRVDTEKLNVDLNGENGIGILEGELLELSGGSNDITYQDNESSRDIEIKITYKPRFQ